MYYSRKALRAHKKNKCGGLMPILVEKVALFRVNCQYCLDDFNEIRVDWITNYDK